ncbi:DUF4185 domain-containing protein [Gordonia sp. zg691]|uniref:DUF4185 domain-containing protein n=1 Tax=Gordonia jinghuaiqii TaxID=2758710 RepID=A0A7D7LUH9_9ACTN|nr:DUF4185 domain-containing protein [Gordonia jinghuaiqii]MBD0861248.1 DUF4185 domain-containing protein [Gordonia jinghuaiqii]MCR5980416.1 DUF4185 domain-containing protein [Gordonia jinghuaiqii]MCR5980423.1 DUF4185 domain-containing protein [Gordonia jinghuaiqii]QMT03400.1 DUF4185 domain-containing protein [Gordonia jinghuaiqii]
MSSRLTMSVRLALAGAIAFSGTAVALTAGAGVAHAAPCGNTGSGSSFLGFGSSGSSGSSGSTNVPNLGPQAPLVPYIGSISRTVGWVTGPLSANRTYSRFGISGTDLGVAWDNGRGQTLMAFGDTFGNCNAPGQQWRHNVLLRTDDDNLANGLTVPDGVAGDVTSGSVIASGQPDYAQELIPSLGISNVEVTTIPTAAISLPYGDGFRQYINYMSVRSWGTAGNWVTNYSAVAHSDDNGQTWITDQDTILVNAPISLSLPGNLRPVEYNNGKFQQNAYVRGRPGTPEADYVYQYGTPNGRFGAAFLARFKPEDILKLDNYEYWAGKGPGWVDDIKAIPDDGSAIVARNPVSELSVAWSPYLEKYIMLDGDNGIRLRTAEHPEGPWSAPKMIVPNRALVLYGPMILPNSPALQGDSKELYFNASRWSDYNVMLIRSDLSKI